MAYADMAYIAMAYTVMASNVSHGELWNFCGIMELDGYLGPYWST